MSDFEDLISDLVILLKEWSRETRLVNDYPYSIMNNQDAVTRELMTRELAKTIAPFCVNYKVEGILREEVYKLVSRS